MNRYSQIVDGKVNWIFEGDTIPEFAPDIIIKDITNVIPQPQEGWDYNSATNTYTPPSNIPIIPPKTPIELLQDQLDETQEQLDVTQASALQTSNDLQGLMDYLIPNS